MRNCIENAYAAYRRQISDLPPVLEGLDEAIAEGNVSMLMVNDAVAGVVIVAISGAVAMLENVAVSPGHMGRGLGRRLIDHAVFQARERGCREIRLNTHAEMTGNVALYEHLGWRVSARQGSRVSMVRILSG